jgi:hypothetical protein
MSPFEGDVYQKTSWIILHFQRSKVYSLFMFSLVESSLQTQQHLYFSRIDLEQIGQKQITK